MTLLILTWLGNLFQKNIILWAKKFSSRLDSKISFWNMSRVLYIFKMFASFEIKYPTIQLIIPFAFDTISLKPNPRLHFIT